MGLELITGRKRAVLILLHPTSLPDPRGKAYGVGELGSEAIRFVDFLADAGAAAWQILPLGHTGYMDSPYQTFSRFAGSPYLISVEKLLAKGDISREEHDGYVAAVEQDGIRADKVDYGWLFHHKLGENWGDVAAVLRQAFQRVVEGNGTGSRQRAFKAFCREAGPWLDDYAEYMAIKERHGHRAWVEWDPPFRNVAAWRAERESILRDQEELDRTVQFYRFVQFLFDEHWNELRGHARKRNCLLIGDLPWYVGYDSADVWARREVFDLDEEGHPRFVAGVPPDYFSPTGQLWGNPVYNWSDDGAVEWWEEAISFTLKRVDILRLDHFRAIDTYWQIPWDWARMEKTAINGLWAKGPGEDLLKKIRCRLMRDGLARSGGQLPIIAEDLGGLDPLFATPHDYPHHWSESHKFPVTEAFRQKIERGDGDLQPALNPETGEYSTRQGVDYLLDAYGLPWMAVIQFGLEGADRHHPDHVPHDCVIYTGTHDNDTALGWYETSLRHRRQEAHEKGHQHIDLHEGFPGNPPVTEVDVHIDIDVEPVRILDPLGQPVTIKDEAPERDVPWEMLELVIKSKSALAGAPMQDLLGLGSEARMNLPGDTHGGWWSWRAKLEQMDYEVLSRRLGKLNDDYGRRE